MADKRKSILVNSLDHCIVCGRCHPHKHEVFFGRNRQLSIKYNMILPLCYEHHEGINGPHRNRQVDLKYKRAAQTAWEEQYGTRNMFISLFGRSYI